ncbi:MAG: prepilin-type N-terminal cleavage/methylation domain-containing protein [Candidatus Omnitrophica bacterium]|nr:prepilin-type N-terminal cleavage/methylation domain-containing protein [Candidatus Omnitrophota bacterium]
MDKSNKSAFTLTEMLVVVVLVGVLVALAMPSFRGAQRRAIDKEAWTNLNMMATALKMRILEERAGAICSDNSDCNDTLDLDLPAAPPVGNWLYEVLVSGVSDYSFEARGSKGTPPTGWQMDEGDDEPTSF